MDDGVAWIFPAGVRSRMGLASYRGETVNASMVRDFLRTTGAEPSTFHGGFFPHVLRRPTVGNIFLVGDSAGQCLPLTGEGIRPAIYFGQRCGHLLQRVIDGETDVRDALREYRRIVGRFRWHYRLLVQAQRALPRLPKLPLRGLLRLLEVPAVGRWCLRRYLQMMSIERVPQSGDPPAGQERTISNASGGVQAGFSGVAHPEDDVYSESIKGVGR